MRIRSWPPLFFLLILLTVSTFFVCPQVTVLAAEKTANIEVKKTELIAMRYDPIGQIISHSAQVQISLTNPGGSTTIVDVVDRATQVNLSTLRMLAGTPEPSQTTSAGDLSLLTWQNVEIQPHSTVKYQYLVETYMLPPIVVNQTLYVNGEKANVTSLDSVYFLQANVSDVVTWQIEARSSRQALYGNREVFPPTLGIISLSMGKEWFSDISTQPEANSTTVLDETQISNWMLMLWDNDPYTLNVSARISKAGPWGEVPINPISVIVSSDNSKLISQLGQLLGQMTALNQIIALLNGTKQALIVANTSMPIAMGQIQTTFSIVNQTDMSSIAKLQILQYLANATQQIAVGQGSVQQAVSLIDLAIEVLDASQQGTGDIVEIADLEDALKAAKYSHRPFLGDVEVYLDDQPPKYSTSLRVQDYSDKLQIIDRLNVTHGSDQYSHLYLLNVLINIEGDVSDVILQVYREGEWQNSTAHHVGASWVQAKRILRLEPRIEFENLTQALLDWTGRDIRVLIWGENVNITYEIDVVPKTDETIYIEHEESSVILTLTQTRIMTQNVTVSPPPPSLPPPSGWPTLTLIIEITAAVISVIMGVWLWRRTKEAKLKKTMEKRAEKIEKLSDADQLLAEIKELMKELVQLD